MIPKIIHQIYFNLYDKEIEDIPLFQKSSQVIQELNPEYEYKLWDEKECSELIKNQLPQYYDFYVSMRFDIQRIDFMRFVILYVYGGFYVDLDLINLKKLDSLLDNKFVSYGLLKFKPEHKEYMQNDFFGSVKGFKLWKILMDLCEPNYRKKESIKAYKEWKGRFVLQTTGPRYICKVVKKVLPNYKPNQELIFTKWRNNNWKNFNKEDFYFENFVANSWVENTSKTLKNNPNFYLKENEL